MGKPKSSRRQFLSKAGSTLAGSALANGPFLALLDAIAQGAIQKAYAVEQGITPRKWLDLKYDGAPPRWVYDLFLKATAADNATFTLGGGKQLATRYTESSGRYTGTQYAVSTFGNNLAPYLWRFNVPSANGGTRPMAPLMSDMLQIRGINSGNPGHSGSQTLHYVPLGSTKSVPALAGDSSGAPIPAVNVGANQFQFRSKAGKSHVNLTGGNLLTGLLAPFRPSTTVAAVKGKEGLVQNYIDAARAALTNSAIARDSDAIVAREAVEGARLLMTRSFGDLTAVWNGLRDKYLDLIDRAIRGTYAGINDKPIGVTGARNATYRFMQSGGSDVLASGDLRAMIGPATGLPSLANAFALAEFVLLNDLSDSITVRLSGFTDVRNGTALFTWNVDEHSVGAMPSLLINSLMALAHGACLLELIDRIKAANLWNETIINNSAEFNRSATTAGIGSDHGYEGASVVLYSGIFNGPIILGNLAANAKPTTHAGTWGYGARQAELGNTQIDRGNVAASYASLLRVPSPITARSTLLNVNGNTVTPTIPAGKIIV